MQNLALAISGYAIILTLIGSFIGTVLVHHLNLFHKVAAENRRGILFTIVTVQVPPPFQDLANSIIP
jgi:hypothetical protein